MMSAVINRRGAARHHLYLVPRPKAGGAKTAAATAPAPAKNLAVRDLVWLFMRADSELSPARIAAERFLLECD